MYFDDYYLHIKHKDQNCDFTWFRKSEISPKKQFFWSVCEI